MLKWSTENILETKNKKIKKKIFKLNGKIIEDLMLGIRKILVFRLFLEKFLVNSMRVKLFS